MAIKTHSFAGRKYRIHLDEQMIGYAEVPPKPGAKEHLGLYVDPYLSEPQFLEVAIHEALHAILPNASEEAVSVLGKELRRWLWRLGYRRKT